MITWKCKILFLAYAVAASAAKQRSWTGPTNFFEGSISARSFFGIAGIDEKIYLFGGYNDGQLKQPLILSGGLLVDFALLIRFI